MHRLVVCIPVIIMLSGCGNPVRLYEQRTEKEQLTSMLKNVNRELSELGFGIDIGDIVVDVKPSSEMARMFNQISNEAQDAQTIVLSQASANEASFKDGMTARLAFYDPNSKSIIFREGALSSITKGYLAHELTHVYQDQKWSFDQIWKKYREDPSQENFHITQFVIEGHAELVRNAYEQRYGSSLREAAEAGATLSKAYANDCIFCDDEKKPANLPYSLGLRFLVHQYIDGGWQSVEDNFLNLPTSSEQIIHPKKFNRDNPSKLFLPTFNDRELHTELISSGNVGEASILVKLLSLDIPVEDAFTGASGWEGDIINHYRIAGKDVLVWRIAFDRAVDAKQFEDALKTGFSSYDIMRRGRVVDMIESPNPVLSAKLRKFISNYISPVERNRFDEISTMDQEADMKNDASIYFSPYYQPKIVVHPRQ